MCVSGNWYERALTVVVIIQLLHTTAHKTTPIPIKPRAQRELICERTHYTSTFIVDTQVDICAEPSAGAAPYSTAPRLIYTIIICCALSAVIESHNVDCASFNVYLHRHKLCPQHLSRESWEDRASL